jgi:ATP-dependent helicase/nuclease subunit B
MSDLFTDKNTQQPRLWLWDKPLGELDAWMRTGRWQPSEVVVLVPFAQLMNGAKQAWAHAYPTSFVPRFETTRNWANRLGSFTPAPDDLSMDAVHDAAVSAALLASIALPGLDQQWRHTLAPQLVGAAQSLGGVVSAIEPCKRGAWLERMQAALALGTGDGFNKWESLLAAMALNWAATSSYATDVLWELDAQRSCVALAVLPGLQADSLSQALVTHWRDQFGAHTVLELSPLSPANGVVEAAYIFTADNAQDEASQAAACVLAHLQAGRVPVAIVAQDRLLTKRIHALLQTAGVDWRDETGWMLSTAPVAAMLMAWLQASRDNASSNQLLDFIKMLPLTLDPKLQAQLTSWEHQLRNQQLRSATQALQALARCGILLGSTNFADVLASWLSLAQTTRTPTAWREAMLQLLVGTGWMHQWNGDDATQQVLRMMRLDADLIDLWLSANPDVQFNSALPSDLVTACQPWSVAFAPTWQRMSVQTFTTWLRVGLEGGSYKPDYVGRLEVSALPMAQLLGRDVGAVVVAGCDATHMPAYVNNIGLWTPPQIEVLGLAMPVAQTQAALDAWCMVTGMPVLDVLWRQADGDQSLQIAPWLALSQAQDTLHMSSPWYQLRSWHAGTDTRIGTLQTCRATPKPQPTLQAHTPSRVSASAYQALRDCPYKFFAMQGMRLWESAELDEALGPRDMGNWLHTVLQLFHEQRQNNSGSDSRADSDLIDQLALQVRHDMGFEAAEFMPFDGNWVQLRDGYLAWLSQHEAQGYVFVQAEQPKERVLHNGHSPVVTITGTIDRVDRHGLSDEPLVLDYKTERLSKTIKRVTEPLEDTQLAFYAALMQEPLNTQAIQTAYLNISGQEIKGKGATQLVLQEHTMAGTDEVLAGVINDITRLQQGHALAALGDGAVCNHCAARGLCRKDFWTQDV